jgi:Zn-dependent M28 family amino/carboxypeptidase
LDTTLLKDDEVNVLRHLKTLSSDLFSGRKFASQGSLQTQSYLISTLEELDVPAFKNRYRHPFEKSGLFNTQQGTNIIAYVPGTLHEEEYIILSAHFDHLGSKAGKVFNGADDNASGTAALLHYAKRLKLHPLRYSVILLFTDGEEVGLLGAKAFVAQQHTLLKQFKLNINVDMIAGSKRTKKLRFISRDLDQILSDKSIESFNEMQAQLKGNATVRLTSGFKHLRGTRSKMRKTNWRMASDHGIFSKVGIPFVYFGVGPHKNYHSEQDDFGNVNQRFFLSATAVIFQQIIHLDTAMSASSQKHSAQKKSTITD